MRGTWVTWVLASADQFRPPPPPVPGSAQSIAELAEVKALQRPPELRRLAYFWNSVLEEREWLAMTNSKIFEARMADDAPWAARAVALVTVAFNDAYLACFEAKYHYLAPRPFQLNPSIDVMFAAPSHPSYPSGHACGVGASEAVLSHLFPHDTELFKQRAMERSLSRLWAGIHFRSDLEAGLTLGRAVGRLTVERARSDDRRSTAR